MKTPDIRSDKPWFRQRSSGQFKAAQQVLLASSIFWMSLPNYSSVLNKPGTLRAPVEVEIKKGPLAEAKLVKKFKDTTGTPYGRLSTGTIVRAEDKPRSKKAAHRAEVVSRAEHLRNVQFSLNAKKMLTQVPTV